MMAFACGCSGGDGGESMRSAVDPRAAVASAMTSGVTREVQIGAIYRLEIVSAVGRVRAA